MTRQHSPAAIAFRGLFALALLAARSRGFRAPDTPLWGQVAAGLGAGVLPFARWIVSALLAAGATSIPQLLVYVLFLGIGNAATTVLFFPLLTDLVPASRVGEFAGLSAFAETGGVVFSVLLAGELINLNPMGLHYRVIFIVTGVCLILGFLAILFVKAKVVQDTPDAPKPAPGTDPRMPS